MFAIPSFADLKPVAIDVRMRTLVYSPDEVFRLKFKVGYQSHIIFAKDEVPILQSFGDSRGWSVKLVGSALFIKPSDPGLHTNMIIETNKNRVYYFDITSTHSEDNSVDDFAYRVNFYYPESSIDVPIISSTKGTLAGKLDMKVKPRTSLPDDNITLNFDYSFAGQSKSIRPLKVFDNGQKTYLLFPDKNAKIPSMYAVMPDGVEYLLAYSVDGDYIVVDTTEYQFALRFGKDIVCIFNNKLLNKPLTK